MTAVQINLPHELAQKAASAGLLSAWQRGPREELTPETEQAIVQDVRKVRAEQRLRGAG
jgi:hypothetical protein